MGTHEDYRPKSSNKVSSDRSFGVVFTVVFLAIGLLPLRHGLPPRLWALAVGGTMLAITLIRPSLLHAANLGWTKLGMLLAKIVNPVVMAVLFYGVVTPVALLMRLLGKDSLRLRWEPETASYWIPRDPPGPDPRTMSNQF